MFFLFTGSFARLISPTETSISIKNRSQPSCESSSSLPPPAAVRVRVSCHHCHCVGMDTIIWKLITWWDIAAAAALQVRGELEAAALQVLGGPKRQRRELLMLWKIKILVYLYTGDISATCYAKVDCWKKGIWAWSPNVHLNHTGLDAISSPTW